MAADAAREPDEAPIYPAGVDAEAIARLNAQPGFAETVRASAASMVEMHRGHRLLNAILNDRGRFIIASFALHLHFLSQRDPQVKLTAARLKAMAVQHDICSPGRAAAVIALMHWGGYLAAARTPAAERSERMVVTGKLIEVQAQRLRTQWTSMRRLFPQAEAALARLDDPRFVAAFFLIQGEEFLSGVRLIGHVPELDALLDRNAGFMIVLSLTAAGTGAERVTPALTKVSISGLARRFGVSRPHVIALLRDAEAAGLLRRTGETVAVTDRLEQAVRRFFALVYLWNRSCMIRALAEAAD